MDLSRRGAEAEKAEEGAAVASGKSPATLERASEEGEATFAPSDHRGHEAFGWLSVEELLRRASRQHARVTGELRAEVARLRSELGGSGKTPDAQVQPPWEMPFDRTEHLPTEVSQGQHVDASVGVDGALGSAGAGSPGDGAASSSMRNAGQREVEVPRLQLSSSGAMGSTQAKAAYVHILKTGSKLSAGRERVHYERIPWLDRLDSMVKSNRFEVVFMGLILANAAVLCLEAEYQGYETGQRAELPGELGASARGWANGDTEMAFQVLEYFFGCAFAAEALMKLMVYRGGFFKQPWNDFDLFVVLFWVLEKTSSVIPVPALVLRLARLVKTLRLVRLTRTLEFADTLNLIIVAVKASLSALVWSLLLLSLITMVLSLVLNYGLKSYVENLAIEEHLRNDMFVYFGTFWRSFLSVIELTIGNWVPITRDLQEYISPWLACAVVFYRLIMEIAVLKVVTGVFLHETFRVAKTDSELMIRGKMREHKVFSDKMASLFRLIDTDGNGKLSKTEFEKAFENERAALYLGALGLDYKDTEELWRLVMQEVGRTPGECTTPRGTPAVSTVDLEQAFAKIRGDARSIDVVMVLQQVSYLVRSLQDLRIFPFANDPSNDSLTVERLAGDCSRNVTDDHSVKDGSSVLDSRTAII